MNSLSNVEQASLTRYEAIIERGLQTFMDVGNALLAIRDKRLYRAHYDTFEDYCQERWGMSRSYAHRNIEAAQVAKNLLPIGNIPANEAQTRPLAKLEPPQQREAWQEAVDTAPDGKVTGAHVAGVVERYTQPASDESGGSDGVAVRYTPAPTAEDVERTDSNGSKPHVSNNSGENEWYTPPEYIDAARRVMGIIDLDPASCAAANEIVQADTYYSKDNDGLRLSWYGNVWMNPPYSHPEIVQFSEKLAESVEAGDVDEAIVLVNNATETGWFNTLLEAASAVCLPKGRIKFIDKHGNPSGAPLQGQAILYFGNKRAVFDQHFLKFGKVLYVRR